jgi:hypothetical protein
VHANNTEGIEPQIAQMPPFQDKDDPDYGARSARTFAFALIVEPQPKKVHAKPLRREECTACVIESLALSLRLGGFA